WILGSRLKGKGKTKDGRNVNIDEAMNSNNDLNENNNGENLIFTDTSDFTNNNGENLIFTDASNFTNNNGNGQYNDSNMEFDESELDEYVEMFKKVWETLQSNVLEKSDDKNIQHKKITRQPRLHEKSSVEDKTSICNEKLSSDSESSIYTDKTIQKVNNNKRIRIEKPKANVKKLNIDFSLIDKINFDDFNHI
ncbi:17468_t:CDS:2, partial [Funneliformis caledonium]